jgi:hypothetical protein
MKTLIIIPIVLILLFVGSACSFTNIEAKVGGRLAPDGTEINLDLPNHQHLQNKAGTNGAGLCVFSSIDHSARLQNIELLIGLRDYMTKHPGGGNPRIVDNVVKRLAKEKGVPVPDYLNLTGKRELLPILKKAVDNGLMPAVTYGRSPTGRYRGQHIDHMVTMSHYDAKGNIAILDNNFPGWDRYEWLNENEFYSAFTDGYGEGWCVILLPNGPLNHGLPPFPWN